MTDHVSFPLLPVGHDSLSVTNVLPCLTSHLLRKVMVRSVPFSVLGEGFYRLGENLKSKWNGGMWN